MNKPFPKPPVVIGEVLYDHFPDGKRILGGAPFNVAWNLQGLGVPSLFVSAVGEDEEAAEIRDSMQQWNMDTAALGTGPAPTGRVSVTFDGGQPQYEINKPAAFDFIPIPTVSISDQTHSLLYLGSLAFRNAATQKTIQHLIQRSGLPRFVDVNIRRPWFEEAWLDVLIHGAKWVKVSDEELPQLTSTGVCDSAESMTSAAMDLIRKYDIENVLVTAGADGATMIGADGCSTHVPAPRPENMTDTVGAGDAFAAASITGLVHDRTVERVLSDAVGFASRVCGLSGATTADSSFYHLN